MADLVLCLVAHLKSSFVLVQLLCSTTFFQHSTRMQFCLTCMLAVLQRGRLQWCYFYIHSQVFGLYCTTTKSCDPSYWFRMRISSQGRSQISFFSSKLIFRIVALFSPQTPCCDTAQRFVKGFAFYPRRVTCRHIWLQVSSPSATLCLLSPCSP